MAEVTYGKTPGGQMLWDFGLSKLSDSYLARKYYMPIARVRKLRAKVIKALNSKKRSTKRCRRAA